MSTYLDEAKRLCQKLPTLLEMHAPFITSKYQTNRQAANEIGLGLAILFVLLSALLLPYDSIELREVIELYIKIVGGTAIFFGAYFAWKRLEVNQEGQITERFTRAIDQLGATHSGGKKNLEVRLGSIYALERITKDSQKDHWPIMEVLTTYVREHSSSKPAVDVGTPLNGELSLPTTSPDVQAILSVIGRRALTYGYGEKYPLNLAETGLPRAELMDADLEEANLKGVNLEEANLKGANLTRVFLKKANLNGANLEDSDLSGANLHGANLNKTNLKSARMGGAYMEKTHLAGACLESTNLMSTTLADADLKGANLHGARLYGANLYRANLHTANLCMANLENAIIDEACLNGACLKGTDLGGAELHRTSLMGADLQFSDSLRKKQIETAIIDRKTTLPADLMDDYAWYDAQIKRSEKWLAED